MDRQVTRSVDIPKWSALLVEAVNKPGLIMEAYTSPVPLFPRSPVPLFPCSPVPLPPACYTRPVFMTILSSSEIQG